MHDRRRRLCSFPRVVLRTPASGLLHLYVATYHRLSSRQQLTTEDTTVWVGSA